LSPASKSPDDEHLLQRGDALGGLPLLVQAEDRVQDGEPENHDPGAPLLERGDAHDRGAHEDELHQVAVLAEECVPAGLGRRLHQLVRPYLGAAPLYLARGEALSRVDAEPLARLVDGEPVPGDDVPPGGLDSRRRSGHRE